MDFRPVSQHLRDINLRILGKFSYLALALGLESASHPVSPVQAPSFSQGTVSPSFATPLGLEDPVRARAEMWNVDLSGAVSVRDELRWVLWMRRI